MLTNSVSNGVIVEIKLAVNDHLIKILQRITGGSKTKVVKYLRITMKRTDFIIHKIIYINYIYWIYTLSTRSS